MRKRDLERLLLEYQSLLGLLDWTIELELGVDPEEEDDDVPGSVIYFVENKTATIWIKPRTEEQEETLVHELAHLLIGIARSGSKGEEQVCWMLGKTLTELRHNQKGSK